MKVTVTHLKAPWPAGTVPGHVVEFPGLDAIPAWAVGKCTQTADDAEAVSVWPVPVQPAELTEPPAVTEQSMVVNPADPDAEAAARAAEALAAAEAQHQAEVAAAAERAAIPAKPKRGASA